MSARFATLARILFITALVFAVVMSLLPQPPALPGEPTDKVQHMLAFVTLTLLMGLGWPRGPLWGVAILMGVLGAGIEVAQGSFPSLNRVADIQDWYADMIATGAALLILAVIRAGLRARSPNAAR